MIQQHRVTCAGHTAGRRLLGSEEGAFPLPLAHAGPTGTSAKCWGAVVPGRGPPLGRECALALASVRVRTRLGGDDGVHRPPCHGRVWARAGRGPLRSPAPGPRGLWLQDLDTRTVVVLRSKRKRGAVRSLTLPGDVATWQVAILGEGTSPGRPSTARGDMRGAALGIWAQVTEMDPG